VPKFNSGLQIYITICRDQK